MNNHLIFRLLILVCIIAIPVRSLAIALNCELVEKLSNLSKEAAKEKYKDALDKKIHIGEGYYADGIILKNNVEIVFEENLVSVVKYPQSYVFSNLQVGSSLQTVEKINKKPYLITGSGWDYGLRSVKWKKGDLDCKSGRIFVDFQSNAKKKEEVRNLPEGSGFYPSTHEGFRKAKLTVNMISLVFDRSSKTAEKVKLSVSYDKKLGRFVYLNSKRNESYLILSGELRSHKDAQARCRERKGRLFKKSDIMYLMNINLVKSLKYLALKPIDSDTISGFWTETLVSPESKWPIWTVFNLANSGSDVFYDVDEFAVENPSQPLLQQTACIIKH